MTGAIAALAMYDWPEVAAANDALWAFIGAELRGHGIAAPETLNRTLPFDAAWMSPGLILAQTCGYPFASDLRGRVQLVGAPTYDAAGCDGPNYSSMIVANRTKGPSSLAQLSRATAAVNSEQSQSGYWALRAALAHLDGAQPPIRALHSGGHRQSLRIVAEGHADVAAIDAVCWALALRHDAGVVANLHVIATSPVAPGLPLISAMTTPPATLALLRGALAAVATEPSLAAARKELCWGGFTVVSETAYDRILELKQVAVSLPFPALEL